MIVFSPFLLLVALAGSGAAPDPDLAGDYAERVKPVLAKHCLGLPLHETRRKATSTWSASPRSTTSARTSSPWQQMIEMLENGEMPPKKARSRAADERRQLLAWVRRLPRRRGAGQRRRPRPRRRSAA